MTSVSVSTLNLEIHPAFFALAAKSSHESLYKSVQIHHLSKIPKQGIDFFQLGEWLKGLQIIKNTPFQATNVIVHGYPISVHQEILHGKEIYESLNEVPKEEHYFFQTELTKDFVWNMQVPQALMVLLNSYFVRPNLFPTISGIFKYMYTHFSDTDQLIAHITPQTVYFIYISDNQPRYYNSFPYTNKEDLLYYILLAYKMFGLSTDSFPLSLSGLIEKQSEIFTFLYQYIRHLDILNFSIPLELDSEENSNLAPSNYFANLIYSSH